MSGARPVERALSSVLDVVGLLAVAVGVAAGLHRYIGGWSVAVGGLIVMAVSWWWGRNRGGEA